MEPTPTSRAAARRTPSGAGSAVLLILGDAYRVEVAARRWVDAWCPADNRLFGLEEVTPQGETFEQVAAALRDVLLAIETPPLFGGGKIVWFRAGDLLASPRLGAPAAATWRKKLVELIRAGLPSGHRLIITCVDIDRRSALYRACQECGEVADYSLPDKPRQRATAVREAVRAELESAGLGMEPDALEAFLDRVGDDGYAIHGEIEKLALYAGDRRTLTADDVAAITSPSRTVEGWDLADRLGARDGPGAWLVFRRLMDQRVDTIPLIAGLEARFRELAVFREGFDRGWLRSDGRSVQWVSSPECAERLEGLGDQNPARLHWYRASRLAEQAQRFTAAELAEAARAISRTREQMVSGFASPELLLELLVLRLARRRR